MNNKRKILILIICLLIILLIYKVIDTYALFHSEINGQVVFENGVWTIYVNDEDITEGTDISFNLNGVEISSDEHVLDGKIAPGLSGSFVIEIDPTDTSVSIRYDITLDKDELTNENFKINSISETGETGALVRTGEETYTGIISLADINNNKTSTINIEFEWEDLNTDEANEADRITGSQYNEELEIPIQIHVIQYLGEEIVEYVEGETGETP